MTLKAHFEEEVTDINMDRMETIQSATKPALCQWCENPFPPRMVGGHTKKFCSAQCRNHYHASARKWVQKAVSVGLLSVADLKVVQASCTKQGSAKSALDSEEVQRS